MALDLTGLALANGPVWEKVTSRGTEKASKYQWYPSEYDGQKLYTSLGLAKVVGIFNKSDARLEIHTCPYQRKDGQIIEVVGFGPGLTEDFTFELWECVAIRDTEHVVAGSIALKIEVL
jgi:hypothetical protein